MTTPEEEEETDSGSAPPLKEEDDSSALVSHLEAHSVSPADLEASVRVLAAVGALHPKNPAAAGGLRLYRAAALRPLRKALASCLEVHKLTMYGGDEGAYFDRQNTWRDRKRQRVAERKAAVREMQERCLAETGLRRGRMERLAELQRRQPEHAHLLVPDGPVDDARQLLLEGGSGAAPPPPPKATILPKIRLCYCCRVGFQELHHFYDKLCPPCAALNYAKRHAMAPACAGRVAIVTGARVKIGFQTALKLLRSGARVVATSRFPNSAVDAYRREPDFADFQDRLSIYGLDLRDVIGIEAFTRFLKQQYPSGVDILIHNACQTIRRPVAYYTPLVEREQALWHGADGDHRQVLMGCVEFERARHHLDLLHHRSSSPSGAAQSSSLSAPALEALLGNGPGPFKSLLPAASAMEVETIPGLFKSLPPSECAVEIDMIDKTVEDPDDGKPRAVTVDANQPATAITLSKAAAADSAVGMSNYSDMPSPFEKTGVSHSAAMSQVVLLPEDVGVSEDVLPRGAVDVNGQQLDLRPVNSWVLKMDQVSTPEVMECFFVNAIAPLVLNSRLKPLMCAGDNSTRPNRFIVNVSAMEGKFYRPKSPNHPHTNMAKSALNMLTRTAAKDLAVNHRIYMNSVDTGWINDENPLERASKNFQTSLFQTPIDEVDGAARILDPIFSSLNGEVETPVFGKFLKDYKETEW